MQVTASKESFLHTVRRFWTGKRFLKLFIFALLMGNVTLYCVGMLARKQVMSHAIAHHSKVYTAYLQAVERFRKPTPEEASGDEPASVGEGQDAKNTASSSPYWQALKEIRRQFPYHRVNVVLESTVEGDKDRKVFELLKNRPRGWMVTDETDGWARSFYVLPSQNTAGFQVVSYVKDELNDWENTSILIGAYAFALLFAFGWFWTRALDDPQIAAGAEAPVTENLKPVLRERLVELQRYAAECSATMVQVQQSVAALEAKGFAANTTSRREFDNALHQIRALAINGSIEAARSSENHRVFNVIMQEINQLATRAQDTLKSNGEFEGELSDVREKTERLKRNFDSISSGAEVGSPDLSGFWKKKSSGG